MLALMTAPCLAVMMVVRNDRNRAPTCWRILEGQSLAGGCGAGRELSHLVLARGMGHGAEEGSVGNLC